MLLDSLIKEVNQLILSVVGHVGSRVAEEQLMGRVVPEEVGVICFRVCHSERKKVKNMKGVIYDDTA